MTALTAYDNRITTLYNKGLKPHEIGKRLRVPTAEIRISLLRRGFDLPASTGAAANSIWDRSEDRIRAAVIIQDRAFCEAVRREHFSPKPLQGPTTPERRPHQFLDVGYRPELDDRPSPLHWKRILAQTASKHGLTVAEVVSKRRNKQVVAAKRECCWRMKRETSMSLPQIGAKLGGLDHTTVLYHIRAMKRQLSEVAA